MIVPSDTSVPAQKFLSHNGFERLKQSARLLKKDQRLTHAQALDQVAREAGFSHWKHVTISYNRLRPTENAARSGVVFVYYDDEEERDVEIDTRFLVQDDQLRHFFSETLTDEIEKYEHLVQLNEEGSKGKVVDSKAKVSWYRIDESKLPENPNVLTALIASLTYPVPYYVYRDGKYYDYDYAKFDYKPVPPTNYATSTEEAYDNGFVLAVFDIAADDVREEAFVRDDDLAHLFNKKIVDGPELYTDVRFDVNGNLVETGEPTNHSLFDGLVFFRAHRRYRPKSMAAIRVMIERNTYQAPTYFSIMGHLSIWR